MHSTLHAPFFEARKNYKPHPQKELKAYQIKQLIEYLEQEGFVIIRYLVAYYKFTPTFMKNSANFTIEAFIPM